MNWMNNVGIGREGPAFGHRRWEDWKFPRDVVLFWLLSSAGAVVELLHHNGMRATPRLIASWRSQTHTHIGQRKAIDHRNDRCLGPIHSDANVSKWMAQRWKMLSHTLSTKTSLADILVHRLKFLTIFFIFCQLSTLLQLNQFELSASDWNLPGAVLCPTHLSAVLTFSIVPGWAR